MAMRAAGGNVREKRKYIPVGVVGLSGIGQKCDAAHEGSQYGEAHGPTGKAPVGNHESRTGAAFLAEMGAKEYNGQEIKNKDQFVCQKKWCLHRLSTKIVWA